MTLHTIFILIFIGEGALLAASVYVAIRSAIDKNFDEKCKKFVDDFDFKQKARQKQKLEEKRQKWLRNEYEIFRAGQRMGTIPSDMTFQDWLR